MNATITTNTEHNGIEISFDCKPAPGTLESLKSHGFRWHRQKRVWYAKNTHEHMAAANAIVSTADYALQIIKEEQADKRPAYGKTPVNKFGVKVGDLFKMSWGWEQTNVNFFQVLELVGQASVRVREVSPAIVDEEAVSGMSGNYRYEVPSELLPPLSSSCFVEDQELGDLHRVTLGYKGKPTIKFSKGYYTATPYDGGTVYVSWYA